MDKHYIHGNYSIEANKMVTYNLYIRKEKKMRKALIFISTCVVLTSCTVWGEASDPMAVTLIAGPEEEVESVSLDDVKTGKEIEIDGFGDITFTRYEVQDSLGYKITGGGSIESGAEAEFACLYYDILNTTTKDQDYLADIEVTAIYDEDYIYGGWAFEFNYDYNPDRVISRDMDDYYFCISPLYEGHYMLGATLPNAVINGNKELKLIIKMGGNEMTYYVKRGK